MNRNFRSLLNLVITLLILIVLSEIRTQAHPGTHQIGAEKLIDSETQNTKTSGITYLVSVNSDGVQGHYGSGYPSISDDGRFVGFQSAASNLVEGDTNGYEEIFVRDRVSGKTQRVSVSSSGFQANSYSFTQSISGNGKFIAFVSNADNLVSGDFNGYEDIFVHEIQTGMTERVSISSGGIEAKQHCFEPSISGNGRYVAFVTAANNLVSGDTNNFDDIFVHDRDTGQTEIISYAFDGTESNGYSDSPSISFDGRYVAFASGANNLVIGDATNSTDIFVHDRQTGETERVSVASDGEQGNSASYNPSISNHGRYVAFDSHASNLILDDTNGHFDIFVHDRQTGITERVSIASDSTQGNDHSEFPSISGEGNHVVFQSVASNLVPDDTNGDDDIFVHDRTTGQTKRVSVSSYGEEGDWISRGSSISIDGRYIAFGSSSSNLICEDANKSNSDVFVHDLFGELGSIQGHVVYDDNSPIQDVTISDDYGHTAITDNEGKYFLDELAPCNYSIMPSKTGYIFSPTSVDVIIPPNADNMDFFGYRLLYLPSIIRYQDGLWLIK